MSELRKDDNVVGYEHVAIVDGVRVVVRTDPNHEPGTIYPDKNQGGSGSE